MLLARLIGDRRDAAMFVARVIIGVIFMVHGVLRMQTPTGVNGFVGFLAAMNFPYPIFFAWFVAIVEPIGGLLLILGILTRWAALLLAMIMIVASIKVKASVGLISSMGKGAGMELDLALLVGLLVVLLQGPGRYSIEGAFKKELS